MENFVSRNLERVKEQIEKAAQSSGRSAGDIKLCAVSKFHSVEKIVQAFGHGQMLFGENHVQEAFSKREFLDSLENGGKFKNLELHMIGKLQSNKVNKAVECASCIQSVDSLKLVEMIDRKAKSLDRVMDIFFEVHTAEDSKSGWEDFGKMQEALDLISSGAFSNIRLTGLMTMAPFTDDRNLVRKSFETLRMLKEKILVSNPEIPLSELSMGMSGDFEDAIAEGSTMVRIGTAIFGEREY